jgi:hypothetical protein
MRRRRGNQVRGKAELARRSARPKLSANLSPAKHRSQSGYGEGPEYSAPQETQSSTVYFKFFTPSC